MNDFPGNLDPDEQPGNKKSDQNGDGNPNRQEQDITHRIQGSSAGEELLQRQALPGAAALKLPNTTKATGSKVKSASTRTIAMPKKFAL